MAIDENNVELKKLFRDGITRQFHLKTEVTPNCHIVLNYLVQTSLRQLTNIGIPLLLFSCYRRTIFVSILLTGYTLNRTELGDCLRNFIARREQKHDSNRYVDYNRRGIQKAFPPRLEYMTYIFYTRPRLEFGN